MTDIVEWLRGHSLTLRIAMRLDEAANEIERLRGALREIHGLGDTPDDSWKAYQIFCKALGEDE